MINPIDGVRRRKEICRPQRKSFHRVIAKMLVEPCPPGGTQRIARLQHRFEPRSKTSAHEAKVAAVFARHQFEDRIRLAMALDAEHDPFIGPLHGSSPDSPVYIYVITAPTRSAATREGLVQTHPCRGRGVVPRYFLGNSSPMAR